MDSFLRTLFGVGYICPTGYEPDPLIGYGLCYEKCPTGYKGISFLCWPGCSVQTPSGGDPITYPNGWTDIGLVCLKNSYYRGQGTIPGGCDNDHPQNINGKCYERCKNENGVQTFPFSSNYPSYCAAACPPFTTSSTLLTCNKTPGTEYTRGWGSKGIGCPSGYTDTGLICWKFPFSFSRYQCPGTDANNNPVNGGSCSYGPRNGNDGLNGRPCSYWYNNNSGPCKDLPNPDLNNPKDPFFNTVLNPKIQNTCEENWGSLCYPKCNIGMHPVGANICSVDCKNMSDFGAFCGNRFNYNRGQGFQSNSCSDPEQILENNECKAPCQYGFDGNNDFCSKSGCPDGSQDVNFLGYHVCVKVPKNRKTIQGTPPIAGLLNYKLNLNTVGGLLRKSFFNFAVTLGVLLVIIGLLYLLSIRSKKASFLATKPHPGKVYSGIQTNVK